MQAPPQYSADGRFWWNGHQWIPTWHPALLQRRSVVPYLIASGFVPGLGSLILGRWRWGGIIFGAWVVCMITGVVVMAVAFGDVFNQLGPLTRCGRTFCDSGVIVTFPQGALIAWAIVGSIALIAWVAGIVDAIRGSEEWNRAHGLPS